jgi:hypothetical protein
MTKTQRILATLSFLITLGSTACDGAERYAPEPPATPSSREALGPVAQADRGGGDGSQGCCGHFMDGDGDGTCDLAASGECRKFRDGRCSCGGACTGCF